MDPIIPAVVFSLSVIYLLNNKGASHKPVLTPIITGRPNFKPAIERTNWLKIAINSQK